MDSSTPPGHRQAPTRLPLPRDSDSATLIRSGGAAARDTNDSAAIKEPVLDTGSADPHGSWLLSCQFGRATIGRHEPLKSVWIEADLPDCVEGRRGHGDGMSKPLAFQGSGRLTCCRGPAADPFQRLSRRTDVPCPEQVDPSVAVPVTPTSATGPMIDLTFCPEQFVSAQPPYIRELTSVPRGHLTPQSRSPCP